MDGDWTYQQKYRRINPDNPLSDPLTKNHHQCALSDRVYGSTFKHPRGWKERREKDPVLSDSREDRQFIDNYQDKGPIKNL